MDRDINAFKNILLLLQCENKEKEDQNVLGNKTNTYNTPLGKISMVRREIRHYILLF